MNKAELITILAEKLGQSRVEAERFINTFTDVITENLQKGEKVTLVGFGTFSVSERGARTGRNPKTGDAIEIAASRAPRFKPGTALKDALK